MDLEALRTEHEVEWQPVFVLPVYTLLVQKVYVILRKYRDVKNRSCMYKLHKYSRDGSGYWRLFVPVSFSVLLETCMFEIGRDEDLDELYLTFVE